MGVIVIKIKVVSVGNLKEQYLTMAQNEYAKRLNKFCKIELVECAECKIDNTNSQSSIQKALDNEAVSISKHLSGYVVVLDVVGKQYDSVEFANIIDKVSQQDSQITFVIGSSHGLADSIKQKANLRLSFSKFTFPHQLMRVILLEQIYRAMCINNNVTYHK